MNYICNFTNGNNEFTCTLQDNNTLEQFSTNVDAPNNTENFAMFGGLERNVTPPNGIRYFTIRVEGDGISGRNLSIDSSNRIIAAPPSTSDPKQVWFKYRENDQVQFILVNASNLKCLDTNRGVASVKDLNNVGPSGNLSQWWSRIWLNNSNDDFMLRKIWTRNNNDIYNRVIVDNRERVIRKLTFNYNVTIGCSPGSVLTQKGDSSDISNVCIVYNDWYRVMEQRFRNVGYVPPPSESAPTFTMIY